MIELNECRRSSGAGNVRGLDTAVGVLTCFGWAPVVPGRNEGGKFQLQFRPIERYRHEVTQLEAVSVVVTFGVLCLRAASALAMRKMSTGLTMDGF